jgi:heme/copper-type cytochrome/quinol oxidase subunit 1
MHWLGFAGMPYSDYPTAFAGWNFVVAGAYVSVVSLIVFFIVVAEALLLLDLRLETLGQI